MAETIQPHQEEAQPIQAQPESESVEPPISRAEQRALLLKELERIEKSEQKEKQEAEERKHQEKIEETQIAQEKEKAEYLAKPAVDFNPTKKQVTLLQKQVRKQLQVLEEHGVEKPKTWKKWIPGWKAKDQMKTYQEVDQTVEEKISTFKKLVNQLPKDLQKNGMSEYLAFVFESPEEAVNLLAGPHSHDGKGWREGKLAYKSVDHIKLNKEKPTEPGHDQLAYNTSQRLVAQTRRRPKIILMMKELEAMAGVEPPITAFQKAFGEKRVDKEVDKKVEEPAAKAA